MKNLTAIHLKKLGLKRKWLNDKSGSWWEKTIDGTIPVNIVYDPDFNDLSLRVKVLDDFKPFKKQYYWSLLLVKKATRKNFDNLIVIAKKIASVK